MVWNMQRIGTGGCREFAPGWETEEEGLRLLGDREQGSSKTFPDFK